MSVPTPWPYQTPRTAPRPARHSDDSRPAGLRPTRRRDRSGRLIEVCFIGDLARALGKSTATIRRWERVGWLPKSPYVQAVRGGPPRRLYPVRWVMGLTALAEEEGIAHRKPASINTTSFERRARELHEQIFGI